MNDAETGWTGVLRQRPRAVLAGMALWCVGLLAFGLYLQHGQGLEPCPMCIVQRYTLVVVMVLATVGAAWRASPAAQRGWAALVGVVAAFGAFVAARQTYLQWYPPEMASCGRDFYGMIEAFPLQRLIPMLFKGSGDCSAVDWTFLGLTIANWSFLNFAAMAAVAVAVLGQRLGR